MNTDRDRDELAAEIIRHKHPRENALTRPDDPLVMVQSDPDFFVCKEALEEAGALLASDWLAAHDRAVAQQALRDAADAEDVLRVALDSMLDSGNGRIRAAGGGNRIFPSALEDDLRAALRLALRDRADTLGTHP